MVGKIDGVARGTTHTGAEWRMMRSIMGGLRLIYWKDWEWQKVVGGIFISCKNNFSVVNNLAFIVIKYYRASCFTLFSYSKKGG
jgi:hypothetical protein